MGNYKTAIIIQARTGSYRLPEKMIRPFFGQWSILDILIERIKKIFPKDFDNIIVATTDNLKDDAIETKCRLHNVKCFRGSENDVLGRFINASHEYGADRIIRVCGDNVFLDTQALLNLYHELETSDADYISYKTKEGLPSILTHYGFWAEGVSLKALEKIARLTNNPQYHEHVTNYIYTHPDEFKIQLKPIKDLNSMIENISNIRLTIDTCSDFNICQNIYSDMDAKKIEMNPDNLIKYLDNHNEILIQMSLNIKQNHK